MLLVNCLGALVHGPLERLSYCGRFNDRHTHQQAADHIAKADGQVLGHLAQQQRQRHECQKVLREGNSGEQSAQARC